MQKILRQISPQTTLAAIFVLSISLFSAVSLFPSLFYRKFNASSYLIFHNCAELLGILVCLSIFGVGWYAYDQSKNKHALFLSTMFLGTGLIGFMHVLSFPEMPPFVTPNSTDKAIQFWLAFRLYYAGAFLASAYIYPETENRWLAKKNLLLFSVAAAILVFTGVIYDLSYLPTAFIEDKRLTLFKTLTEYAIVGLLALSFAAYWSRFSRTKDKPLIFYLSALVLSIFSELAFTLYKSAFDTYNMLGHFFELGAFFLIYKGIFATTIAHPYEGFQYTSKMLELDIAERKKAEEKLRRLNRELQAISSCNHILVRASDEQTLLNEICRIICDEAGYRLAWVGYAENDDAKTIRPVAWAGFDSGYIAEAKLSWSDDTERGQGPAGRAIRSREITFVQDFKTDLRVTPWRERALERGYRSTVALPLKDENARVFGVLLIYHSEPNAMTPNEIQLMEELAADLAFGIMVLRTRVEREMVEEALKDSEEQLRMTLEATQIGIWDWDVKTDRWYASPMYYTMLGYEPRTGPGDRREWLERVHPEDRAYVYEQIQKVMVGDFKGYQYEARLRHADGTYRWQHIRGMSVKRDEVGKVARVLGIRMDVDQLKRAEEKNSRLAAIVESSDDAIIGKTLDGIITSWNKGAEKIYGYEETEAVGKPISLLVPPGRQDEVSQFLERMRHGEHVEHYETVRRKKDGREVDVSLTISPIKSAEGRFIGASTIARDVTERKRAEEVQKRLSTAIEQSAEAVIITDANGVIQYVNPATERITGFCRSEMIGSTPRIFKSGEHDANFYRRLWSTINEGNVWSGRLTNKKKDGSLYHEEATISPVKDASGKITNHVAVMRDITEHLQISLQLQQAQKMEAVGTLAGGIAHDFNNLLQVVLGYSELVLSDEDLPDRLRDDMGKVLLASRNGADLVQRLLTFSRKSEAKPLHLDLNQRIRQTQKFLQRIIPTIDIELILTEDLARIQADPTQLDQVLMNLALNARDAMPDGGRLTIETTNATLNEEFARANVGAKPGKYVLLSVSDTGHGMDKETVQHIFEPFYTTKELGKGTGLGLAMVYGIVKQHDGYITCSSEPGQGTTFKIYLPALVAEGDHLQTAARETMPAGGTETILLVDDEEFVRDLGKLILERSGYPVLSAANGKEALDVYKREKGKISLVILDLIMPEMGGKQCLEELLKINPSVKVVVASGFVATGQYQSFIEMGAKGFVNKPYDIRAMLEEVRMAIDSE